MGNASLRGEMTAVWYHDDIFFGECVSIFNRKCFYHADPRPTSSESAAESLYSLLNQGDMAAVFSTQKICDIVFIDDYPGFFFPFDGVPIEIDSGGVTKVLPYKSPKLAESHPIL